MNYFNQLIYSFISVKKFQNELNKKEDIKNSQAKYEYLIHPKTQYLANKYKNKEIIQAALYTNLIDYIKYGENNLIKAIINLGANINREPNTLINALLTEASHNPTNIESTLNTIIEIGFDINQEFDYGHRKNNFICKVLNEIRPKSTNNYLLSFEYFDNHPEELNSHPKYQFLEILLKKEINFLATGNETYNVLAEAIKTRSSKVVQKILSFNLPQNYFSQTLEFLSLENKLNQETKEILSNMYLVYQEKRKLDSVVSIQSKPINKSKLKI